MLGCAYLTRPEGLLYSAWSRPSSSPRSWCEPLATGAADARRGVDDGRAARVPDPVRVVPAHEHRELGATAKTNDVSIEAWQAVADHDRRARDAEIYELADDGVSFVNRRASLTALAREDLDGLPGHRRDQRATSRHRGRRPRRARPTGLGWALLPLPISLLAAWGAWRLRRRPSVWLLLTCMALPTLTALAFFVQARYLIPATAFCCVLAGLAFTELKGWASRVAIGVGAVFLLLSLLAAADGDDGFLNRREPVELQAVGEWLHENTPSDPRVMTRSMVTEYYADRRAVAIPYASPEEVLRFAAHHGVDYIVADSYTYRDLRPQLIEWSRGNAAGRVHDRVPGRAVGPQRRGAQGRRSRRSAETPEPPGIGFMGDG